MNPATLQEENRATADKRFCEVRRLGRIGYGEAFELQKRLVEDRFHGRVPDTLLLLEHPHVITLGRNAGSDNLVAGQELLDRRGVEVFETDRGGDVTYHGPGQLVGYPVLDLRPDRRDLVRYVHDVEAVLIGTLADFGIEGRRIEGKRGVWVREEKVAAVGIRISRWVTSHGFALNVSTDLDYFSLIVPCGIEGCRVTSLERLLNRSVALDEVMDRLEPHFARVFDRKLFESHA